MDDVLGTGADTETTTHTTGGIYLGNAIDHRDGLNGAGGSTVTTAKTAVGTSVLPTIEHSSGVTGLDAVIDHLIGVGIKVTITSHNGHQVAGLFYYGDAQNLTDLVGGIYRAGDTEIGSGLAICKGSGILVTAGIATGATVDTGEAGTDVCHGLIHFDTHKVGSNRKEDTC